MPVLKANHRQVMAAKAIDGKKTRYRIEGVPGLWLYVGLNEVRTWYARYQIGSGKARKEKWFRIGDARSISLGDAIERAKQVDAEVEIGAGDPQQRREEERKATLTFGGLYNQWLERYARPNLARVDTDETTYRCHVEKELGPRPVKELTRVGLGEFRDKVAGQSTVKTAGRVMVLLSRVFNWGMDEGLVEFNPSARLRKARRTVRDRVLSRTNIAVFWHALEQMESMTGEHMARAEKGRMLSPGTRSILRLLLLTGQRRAEVAGARKVELEVEDGEVVWRIPAERSKNGLLQRVPLGPMARAEFEKAVRASPSGSQYIFASPEDPSQSVTVDGVTRAMARFVVELGIPTVSPHDLRRTVGTEMARLGISREVRALVFNHTTGSRSVTDAVYNRYAYDKEKREAFMAWEKELSRLVASNPLPPQSEALLHV